MKTYLYACLLYVGVACSSPNSDHDKVKVFLTEWSQAIASGKNETVMKFYDARFIFPKVLFDLPEGLSFTLEIENAEISVAENENNLKVSVPFNITATDGSFNDTDHLQLTLKKTQKGFIIEDMSQELAVKIKEYGLRLRVNDQHAEVILNYDSILGGIHAMITALSKDYDSIVFYTTVDDITLFYVVNGNWQNPYGYDAQRDAGDYKMGVVTATNKIIVPVEYDKIYNPHGTFQGMIEVQQDGKRGLFSITGEIFIPCEYDGIYPSNFTGVFAQVKQDEKYGWVDDKGKVSLNPASHADKSLFQSPLENQSVLDWKFMFPGPIALLINPYDDPREGNGILIYPSFVRDFGITNIANNGVILESSEYGMGMYETEIKFEKVETLSERFFALVSLFMEAGADARGYHTSRNDLIVVDREMQRVDYLEGLKGDEAEQNPCGATPEYKTIEPGLYESNDGHGVYKYYKVTAEGTIEVQETVRQFNFTKFAKIDEQYFDFCQYENLEYDPSENSNANIVVSQGISANDLDVMRNEIFAEYGFIFKSEKWKKYFESKPWYKPQYENVDKFLTETDKHNIKFILDYQRKNPGKEVQRDSIQFMWAG